MAVIILAILQNVLAILEIGIEGDNLLLDHGISLLRDITNTADEAYQYMAKK